MAIGTLSYRNLDDKSFFNTVRGQYRTPITTSVGGTISIVTNVFKFGIGSAFLNGLGSYQANSNPIFAHGSNNFTYEGWYRFNSAIGTQFLLDQRVSDATIIAPTLYWSSFTLHYYTNGANRISASWSPSTNIWYHVAVSRSGTSTRLFIDGTQVGSTYTDSNVYVQGGNVNIGNTHTQGTSQFKGHIDEYRISNVARYTANFTPPTSAFMNDTNTLLLTHLDTDFSDYVF